MKNKLVYLIILNWNGWKDTVECVESCLKLKYPDVRILIVDNGSTDGSEMVLRPRFPSVEFIQTGENLGFAGGNNAGIRHALERGAEYIWLLNNDTVVDQEALGQLVTVAETDEKIGIVGSKIYYFDKPDVLWFAGGRITKFTKLVYHTDTNLKDPQLCQKTRDVDFITGCSLLIRSSTIRQVGFMSEEFFHYFEDADWNIRIKDAGWRVVWAAGSKVWHKVSSIHGEGNPFLNYYVVRNSLQYVRRNRPFYLPFTLIVLTYHFILRKMIGHVDAIGATWAIRGLKDFFAARFGRYQAKTHENSIRPSDL